MTLNTYPIPETGFIRQSEIIGKPGKKPKIGLLPFSSSTLWRITDEFGLSAVDGLGLTTPQELVITSGMNFDTVALRDTQQTTGRRWIHNVGKKISLLVLGLAKTTSLLLTAARGHSRMQAQSGDAEVIAEQNLNLFANKGKGMVYGGEDVTITDGISYIRLHNGEVEIGCPGTISIMTADHNYTGPTSMSQGHPAMPPPDSIKNWIAVSHFDPERKPMAGQKYTIHFADGSEIKGELDSQGKAHHDNVPELADWVEYEARPTLPEEPWASWQKMLSQANIQGEEDTKVEHK